MSIENRLNALDEATIAIYCSNNNISNRSIEIQRIISEEDLTAVVEMESMNASIVDQINNLAAREARKLAGRKAKLVCQEVLDLIAGFNIERALTVEQIATLKTTFATIKEYLNDSQPWSAKAEVEALTPDGTLVTQEMKDDILQEFSESGLQGL